MIVIPLILYLLKLYVRGDLIIVLIKTSIVIGILVLLFFSLMLIIELRQDKKINIQYNELKYQKIQVEEDLYECQHCGNQKVKEADLYCNICGIRFK